MFQMTVENALKIHDNLITVSGPCINKNKFSASPLSDENGNIYEAHTPFTKTLVHNKFCAVLGIIGSYDVESFIGKIL